MTAEHPMQPVVLVEGVARFKANAILEHLFDTGALDLNAVARLPFSAEDRMQVAQLLGYSVSGFGDLSYADPAVVAKADAEADRFSQPEVVHTSPTPAPDHGVRYMIFETWGDGYVDNWLSDEAGPLPSIQEPYRSVLATLRADDHLCADCTNAVGPVLEERDDRGREVLEWHYLTIAHDGSRTWLLCEECTSPLVGPEEVFITAAQLAQSSEAERAADHGTLS